MINQWNMVRELHQKMKHPVSPTALTDEQKRERYWLMHEAVQMFLNSSSVSDQAKALVGLLYLIMENLVGMGVKPERLFDITHEYHKAKSWMEDAAAIYDGAIRGEIKRQEVATGPHYPTHALVEFTKTGERGFVDRVFWDDKHGEYVYQLFRAYNREVSHIYAHGDLTMVRPPHEPDECEHVYSYPDDVDNEFDELMLQVKAWKELQADIATEKERQAQEESDTKSVNPLLDLFLCLAAVVVLAVVLGLIIGG